jgi:hypothetical protein
MTNYVNQLVADLEKAKNNEPPVYNVRLFHPDDPALAYGLDGVAEFLNAPEYPLQEILGINSVWFPPLEKLTEGEIKLLVDKTLELWSIFNYEAEFPKDLPDKTKYSLIVKKLQESTQYISEGTIHFEFCDYNVENCHFGKEYCQCVKFL